MTAGRDAGDGLADMMAWLYTGGKTDARAKLPACTSAVSTPSVMSVTRVIAIVASPLMRLAYVMQPVSASRTAMAKSGAVTIAPGREPVRDAGHHHRVLRARVGEQVHHAEHALEAVGQRGGERRREEADVEVRALRDEHVPGEHGASPGEEEDDVAQPKAVVAGAVVVRAFGIRVGIPEEVVRGRRVARHRPATPSGRVRCGEPLARESSRAQQLATFASLAAEG